MKLQSLELTSAEGRVWNDGAGGGSKRRSANRLIIEKLSGDFMDSFEGYQVPEIDLGSRG